MVFGVCRAIDLVVPDIPETLDIKIKRERYLAKQALADAEQLLQQVLFLYHILIRLLNLYFCLWRIIDGYLPYSK